MYDCVGFAYFGLPNWICRGTEELTIKVGDLVRTTDNKVHKCCGYGFVVEDHPTRSSKKVFWLGYRGKMNPRWMYIDTLEKVE